MITSTVAAPIRTGLPAIEGAAAPHSAVLPEQVVEDGLVLAALPACCGAGGRPASRQSARGAVVGRRRRLVRLPCCGAWPSASAAARRCRGPCRAARRGAREDRVGVAADAALALDDDALEDGEAGRAAVDRRRVVARAGVEDQARAQVVAEGVEAVDGGHLVEDVVEQALDAAAPLEGLEHRRRGLADGLGDLRRTRRRSLMTGSASLDAGVPITDASPSDSTAGMPASQNGPSSMIMRLMSGATSPRSANTGVASSRQRAEAAHRRRELAQEARAAARCRPRGRRRARRSPAAT